MNRYHRGYGGLAILVIWLAQGGIPAAAQQPPDESILTFERDKGRFEELLQSGRAPESQAERELLTAAARYYLQRVALLSKKDNPAELHRYVTEFQALANRLKPDAKKRDFQRAFALEAVKALGNILSLDPKQYESGVLYGAFLLEPLGQLGQPAVADFLADVIASTRNEAVRLYALKGLQEYFQQTAEQVWEDFRFSVAGKERERQVHWLGPVVQFVLRPPPADLDQDAFCFLRREAIKVLSAARLPAIPALNSKEPRVPVALALARVLAAAHPQAAKKNLLLPPPTLSERVEAALGLCQLKTEVPPKPQAPLVVFLVGKTLLDLTSEYFNDQTHFKGKGTAPPLLPWRYYGERWKQALAALKTNYPAAAPLLEKLLPAAEPILRAMSDRRSIDESYRNRLKEALEQLPAPTPAIYEGLSSPSLWDTGLESSPQQGPAAPPPAEKKSPAKNGAAP